ncbi:MAG: hypothetical protein K9M03_00890 [Kiritimatiellales bacterium]|nr:hypothetical protein [Kiritimatiellales bacterium]
MKHSIFASSVLFASICITFVISTEIDRIGLSTQGQLSGDTIVDDIDVISADTGSGTDIVTEDTGSGTNTEPDDLIPDTPAEPDPVVPVTPITQPSIPKPVFYRNGLPVEVVTPKVEEPEVEIPIETPEDIEPEVEDTETGSGDEVIPSDNADPTDGEEAPEGTQEEEKIELMHYASAVKQWPIIPIVVVTTIIALTLFGLIWFLNRKKVTDDATSSEEIGEDGIAKLAPQITSDRLKQALNTLESDQSERTIPINTGVEVVTPADVIEEESTNAKETSTIETPVVTEAPTVETPIATEMTAKTEEQETLETKVIPKEQETLKTQETPSEQTTSETHTEFPDIEEPQK